MKRAIVGAGGQGRVVAENWRAQHPAAEFLFVDDAKAGQTVDGVRVAGRVDQLARLLGPDGEAVIAIGDNRLRVELAARLAVRWGTVIHPSATVMPSASVGAGAVVFAGALVNTAARIGAHVIVNTGAIVEHDCVLEDGCSLGPGVCMAGRVHVGAGAFLSTGVTLAPRVRVGAGTVVGAGAVVAKDLPDGVLALGVPARVVRPLGDFDWKRLL